MKRKVVLSSFTIFFKNRNLAHKKHSSYRFPKLEFITFVNFHMSKELNSSKIINNSLQITKLVSAKANVYEILLNYHTEKSYSTWQKRTQPSCEPNCITELTFLILLMLKAKQSRGSLGGLDTPTKHSSSLIKSVSSHFSFFKVLFIHFLFFCYKGREINK